MINRILKLTTLLLMLLVATTQGYSQVISGLNTIPGMVNTTYVSDLTQLAALLNVSTVSGTAIFEFTNNYTDALELYPITFNYFPGTTGPGKVIIRPAASVTTRLVTAGAISIYGAQNITFDGRPGGTGNAIMWQFQNGGAASSTPNFQLADAASNDVLEYLSIQSSATNTTATISIGTTNNLPGCSNNIIQFDSIGNYGTLPYFAIRAQSISTSPNSNNKILNNKIYNIQGYYAAPYGAGVYVAPGNGSGWNISNNSFYNTVTTNTGCVQPIAFLAGSASVNDTISGNYIGGQAALCGGAPWKQFGNEGGVSWPPDFIGIYTNAGSVLVSNNTIQNLSFGGGGSFYSSPQVICMRVEGGTADFESNTIGSATTANSVVNGYAGLLLGINNADTGTVIINNNTIANLTQGFFNPAASQVVGPVTGIFCYSGSGVLGSSTITNNKIFNLSSNNYNHQNQYYPVNGGGGGNGIYGNNYTGNVVTGISVQTAGSGAQLISKNTIYNLVDSANSGSSNVYVNGIVANCGTGGITTVNANLIYGLWVSPAFGQTNAISGLTGIYLPTSFAGKYFVTNNMIQLGTKGNDGGSVFNSAVTGIWDNNNDFSTNLKMYIYHNSVYIGGTDNNIRSNNVNSFAFRREQISSSSVYDSLNIKNNIFVNNRTSSSGTGKNYGLYFDATTDISTDYNDVYGTGTNYQYGYATGTIYLTQTLFRTDNAGQEANSISSDPQYNSPTTTTPDLHVQNTSPIAQAGTAANTVIYDFDSLVRANNTPVDIGAAVVGGCSAVTPTVTINASQNNVCASTAINFTTTQTNGGNSPTYNFYVNGVSAQNGASSSYNTTTLNEGDLVWVVITSNAACATPDTAISTKIAMQINPSVTPTVTISPSQNNVCAGSTINFTTTESNGGSSPAYNFLVNGNSKQSGASSSYSTASLNNNDSVWVIMTSNAACASPTTATSTKAKMQLTTNVTPTVTVSPSQNNVCTGTTINFTTTENNGGVPTYNFFVNGSSKQNSASSSYSSNSLNNKDSVWVVMTSNATCASPTTATSTKAIMVINPNVTPTVTISPSLNNVRAGTTVNFTTTENNGGSSPAYNFVVNGASKQSGSSNSYSTNSLNNNDSVWVVLTSNVACASTTIATSTKAFMVINPSVTPTVTISPSQNNVCSGTAINFTTTENNGGSSPTYNFLVNGSSKQSGTSSSYSTNSLNNNDSVWVVLTSNAVCPSPTTATSSHVYSHIYQPAASSFNASICTGSSYPFKGSNLTQPGSYADTLNTIHGCDSIVTLILSVSSPVTTNLADTLCKGESISFKGQSISTSGIYRDTLTAVSSCDSFVILTITTPVTPIISKEGNDTLFVNGTYATYQWILDGQALTGANSASYVATQSGSYSVAVTSYKNCEDTSAPFAFKFLGINNVAENINVRFYPNPGNGYFVLEFADNTERWIEVTDALGRCVVPEEKVGMKKEVILNAAPAGMYFLSIKQNGAKKVIKFINAM